MPQYYSFKTEVDEGESCFFMDAPEENWIDGQCTRVIAYLHNGNVSVTYTCSGDKQRKPLLNSFANIASREAFLEWQSRLMDCARDQFKFKGNMDKMFGPESYSNWIPFYKADISPSNAYMQGMGLIDLTAEEEV